MKKFAAVLAVLAVIPFLFSLGGNPFGPYIAAYVSSALLITGIYELFSAVRAKRSIKYAGIVIAAGAVTALPVNMAGALGLNLYLAFILGQVFTVGIVRWIFVSLPKLQAAAE